MHYIEFVQTKLVFPPLPRWRDSPRWWLVKLLGGANPYETLKVVRIPIDAKDFMGKLYAQRRELFEQFNREPKELLIGGEDYEEMMNCKGINRMFSFDGSYNKGRSVMGLRIKVIPWMRGALVMPD